MWPKKPRSCKCPHKSRNPIASQKSQTRSSSTWRNRLHEVIFEADTPAGKAFDIALIIAIMVSVAVVMIESVPSIRAEYGRELLYVEWFFTLLFTVEYITRLVTVSRPAKYARSFFGLVDLFAVVPTYISVLLPGVQYLLVIRMLRLLRVFRVLKLAAYLAEAETLMKAMRASQRKITVFLLVVLILVVILGSIMYFVEGEEGGYTSIPKAVYWAIVTLTTVGYGDIAPQTPMGQAIASIVMIMGYGIIAVPTGIVTAELTRASKDISTQACEACSAEGHDVDAEFCKRCGERLYS